MEEFKEIPYELLRKSPTNPRRHRDPEKFASLCASVKEKGIIQPIVVRALGDLYEVVVGEGRWLAAGKAKMQTVPAVVRQLSDIEAIELQVIENGQREDLHPLDEAEGYWLLRDKGGYDVPMIASKVSMSESWVYQRMKLTELIEPAKKDFIDGKITAGHAIQIARLQPKEQEAALKACYDDQFIGGKIQKVAISVRELEAWIHDNVHLDLHKAPWKKDDPALVPATGPCTSCPKRTGFMPQLFPDIAKKDTCTDPACFKAKQNAFIAQKKVELTEPAARGSALAAQPPVEISTSWMKPKKKGVYGRSEYTEVEKRNECHHVVKAIVVEGDNDVGKVKDVCVSQECKTHTRHHHARSADSQAEARMRREREREEQAKELRTRIFKACVPRLPEVLGERWLKALADIVYTEADPLIDELHGWKTKGMYLSEKERRDRIDSLSGMKLGRFICAVLLAQEVEAAAVNLGRGKNDFLLDTAKFYKVDVKKIEREFQKELDAKKQAEREAAAALKKAEREKQKKKAATPNRAGDNPKSETALIAHALHANEGADKVLVQPDGSTFYVYPETTCIHCGCTEFSPCPDGCDWAVQESKTHRGLCTVCRRKGLVFSPFIPITGKEVELMGAKKARKKKSTRPAKASSKEKNARAAAGA